jgi:hypothetical protein
LQQVIFLDAQAGCDLADVVLSELDRRCGDFNPVFVLSSVLSPGTPSIFKNASKAMFPLSEPDVPRLCA